LTTAILDNVTVDFPIYGSSHKNLRQTLFAGTAKLFGHEVPRQSRVVVRALENVTFELNYGDRLGLIGHNGAGKSTLLRVLAGVYAPTTGAIRLEGRISPLFNAAPGLDPEDTGYENIKTCGMFLGMHPAEIEKRIPDIAEFSELGEYLSLPVRTYSAGMVTRLGYAIATSIDPDILLLDEGLATGDARFAARAEERLQSLIARSSILVVASHSDTMIKAMCNRVALLEKGHVIALGAADNIIDLYHQREIQTAAVGGTVAAS
jgi:ABC-type polysaccharide/polyol phosphate transport system ATPase subunit